MKLNLGCGRDIRSGYINVDSVKLPGVDKVFDLNKKRWPFKENTFDEINCKDIIEHLDDPLKAMSEIWRISKPEAIIRIHVPFFPGMYAVGDLTHKHFFNYNSFDCFSPGDSHNYYTDARFKIIKRKIIFSWNGLLNIIALPINMFPMLYQRYGAFVLPSNAIDFKLIAKK